MDGTPVVEGLAHFSPEQAGAAADAVRAVISSRFRVPALSVDEILAMREHTALGDTLEDLRGAEGISILVLSIPRLGILIGALHDAPFGLAHAILDQLEDLHAAALRAALDAPSGDPALQ